MSTQYELFLPRHQAPDTDAKLVWRAFQDAQALDDHEEADRLLAKWRSLQPKVQNGGTSE